MTLWYYEERSPLGRWTPRTSPEQPTARTISGRLIKIRAVREIEPCLLKLTLKQLWAVYSPDGPFNTKAATQQENH